MASGRPAPVSIPRAESRRLAPLFADRTELRAVVDCVIEGNLGAAVADRAEAPRVARLDIGCYAVFGGDARLPVARRLVADLSGPLELAFPSADDWRQLLRDVHGARLSDRSMRSFDAGKLDAAELADLSRRLPDGFTIERLGADLASRLDRDLEPNALQVFEGPRDLAIRGIGFCATRDGEIGCVASSYTFSAGAIELAIATHPRFRQLGLARAVAARLALHCVEREIVPHWNAANPVSQHLAETLGYRPAGICEILFLKA